MTQIELFFGIKNIVDAGMFLLAGLCLFCIGVMAVFCKQVRQDQPFLVAGFILLGAIVTIGSCFYFAKIMEFTP